MAKERYMVINEAAETVPDEFQIPTLQYHRLFKSAIYSHCNNKKCYCALLNFAVDAGNDKLQDYVTSQFIRRHPEHWLAWLFRAKVIERQSSDADARRIYNMGCDNIKEVRLESDDGRYVTDALGENEKLIQHLPGDALPLYLNWAIMEAKFVSKLTKDMTPQQI